MGKDMWRHNLYTIAMEGVEDILVQFGIDIRQEFRLAGIGINLILHIEIIQRRNTHKGLWFLLQMLRFGSSSQQQVANQLPLHIIADGHLRMHNDTVVMRREGVVSSLRCH